jgi:hypothetical protein
MGFLKGKLAIKMFKSYPKLRKKPYWGNHFWARGYFISTVGLNEDLIRRYFRHQEEQERRDEDERRDFDLFNCGLRWPRGAGPGVRARLAPQGQGHREFLRNAW